MNPPDDPAPVETPAPAHFASDEEQHPDPITGEPGAHPVGVGVGAIGAGLAGAAIGAIGGPVGVLIGAAIGAVAGGLAGKEVAGSDDDPARLPGDASASAAELSGFDSTGVPAANLPAAFDADTLGTRPGDGVTGSNLDEPGGVTAGQFHEAFTATTLHETEAENQLTESAAPTGGYGSGELGGTPFGAASAQEEQVRHAAYFRFLERARHGIPGDALGDWVSAERELPVSH